MEFVCSFLAIRVNPDSVHHSNRDRQYMTNIDVLM